ncbi:MAG: hypothetical protein BWK80_34655 [Desulfobacteraceae bacterium IS3]|nr:MAG: hypothetical protein BWK80_34655 [Desulfobacteraceae bacterium IS3]
MSELRTKRCPYCSAKIKVEETICFSCKHKVGPPNEHGVAEKPTDWLSYIIATIACGGFVYFIIWLFFLKESAPK